MKKLLSWLLLFAMLLGTFSTFAVAASADTPAKIQISVKANNPNVKITSDTGDVSKLNDGDFNNNNNLWDGGETPATFVMDLGGYFVITDFGVKCFIDSSRWYQYEIYTSTDGESWQLSAEKKDEAVSDFGGKWHTPKTGTTKARYVKFVMTSSSVGSALLREFQVFGYEDPSPDTENVALGKTVTVDRGSNASAITDGNRNLNNIWSADGDREAWAEIDLGGYYKIPTVNVETWHAKGIVTTNTRS